MTINDMLESGVAIQGFISVSSIDHESNVHLWFEQVDEWFAPLDDGWANNEVRFMYAVSDYMNHEAALLIEVEHYER